MLDADDVRQLGIAAEKPLVPLHGGADAEKELQLPFQLQFLQQVRTIQLLQDVYKRQVLYTIPAISLLGILIPFSGIGNKTAVIALTVYGIMPMVHNTYVGLTTLDPDILEAARGMGSTGTQALFRVKLPMAAGVILAGVRNMVVMTISVAGIASFVGAGGLGVAVYRGITIYDPAMTAAGSILIALLAIVCDLTLGALERYFKKRGS